MQAKVELWTLKERVLKGSRWQDHQRLQFEVIHNSDTTLFKSLLTIYREVIKEQPRPLLRWAYTNCTSEIFEHNICMLSEYTIKKEDYLTEEEAVGLYKTQVATYRHLMEYASTNAYTFNSNPRAVTACIERGNN